MLIYKPNNLASLILFCVSYYHIRGFKCTEQAKQTISSHQHDSKEPIFLESMEDLEQVAYLSLRNFNITDEALLQSSWLMGLSSNPNHKQHQKATLSASDLKSSLSLMLESFTSHLRNGHLRRLQLDELEDIVKALNQTRSEESMSSGLNETQVRRDKLTDTSIEVQSVAEPADRCHYLVALFEFDLRERQKSLMQQRMMEYESVRESSGDPGAPSMGSIEPEPVDVARLMQLCQLAVKCHSADELVNLIGSSWSQTLRPAAATPLEEPKRRRRRRRSDELEQSPTAEQWPQMRTKSLRDSLSLSLAKLCPLILFQLHADDGLCSVRRDDRPPMITVWGFATLFVTIVSFCSLIGLSITPLLGPSVTEASGDASGSELAEQANGGPKQSESIRRPISTPVGSDHRHKACLTLFEGLAVGSLVGSALFSLIPQAFELQERESNQGFLLKALIIFFGIYLFFCSERLMRIILDTRQQRKRKKGLNHRSSNLPSTTGADFEHHQLLQQNATAAAADQHRHQHALKQKDRSAKRSHGNGRKSHQDQWTSNLSAGSLSAPKAVYLQPASKLYQRNQTVHLRDQRRQYQEQVASGENQHIKIGGKQRFVSSVVDGAKSVNFPKTTERFVDESAKFNRFVDGQQQQQQQQQVAANRLKADSKSVPGRFNQVAGSATKQRVKRRKTRQQLYATKRQLKRNRATALQQQLALRSSAINHQTDSPTDQQLRANSRSSSVISLHLGANDRELIHSSCSNHRESNGEESNWPYLSGSSSSINDDELSANDYFSDDDKQLRAVNQHIISKLRRQQTNCSPSRSQTSQRTSFQLEARAGAVSADLFFNRPVPDCEQDISTVAWMIVLGDGLHNFIDGISIGAAFSESILSGVSISVAVICEEFPHELGDFAVLVSSGMTVHQALGYNFLSACTCYFGMAVGIILGDVNDGASYISALAAGVFLYIALVDMMGELSATLEETSRDSIAKTLKLLLLQNVGIFIGISIIFILSFIDF